MSLSLVVTSVGALVAVAWTGVLAARAARRPSGHLIAWTLALFGLAVGLAAQALGYLLGYDAIIFRAMELGGQVLAPLAACLGIVEVTARRTAGRFAMRLAVCAIAIIAIAVLGTDPISSGTVAFGKSFPDPVTYYQYLPQVLIAFVLGPFTAMTGLTAVIVGLIRSRGSGRGNAALAPVVAGVAALLLAAPAIDLGLQQFAQITVPLAATKLFGPAYLLAAVLIWLAANQAGDQAEAAVQRAGREAARNDDGWADQFAHPGEAHPDDLGFERGRNYASDEADGRYPGLADLVARADRTPGEPAGSRVRPVLGGPDGWVPDAGYDQSASPAREDQASDLFGQIEIFTLVQETAEFFDRITERVVAQVRSREPGTLVYIVHEVPTAPAQRILYEVYRDRTAYEEHLRQPYVARYAEERRPMVLATNLIELGLQQAKVSPLPSLSDILEQSGIDLTGVTRSGQRKPAEVRPGPPHPGDYVEAPADRQRSGQRPADLFPGESFPAESYHFGPRAAGAYAQERMPPERGPGGPPGPAGSPGAAGGGRPARPAAARRDRSAASRQPGIQQPVGRHSQPGLEPGATSQPAQSDAFGRSAQPGAFGQLAQPGAFGQPAQPGAFGQPAQPGPPGQPGMPGQPPPLRYPQPGLEPGAAATARHYRPGPEPGVPGPPGQPATIRHPRPEADVGADLRPAALRHPQPGADQVDRGRSHPVRYPQRGPDPDILDQPAPRRYPRPGPEPGIHGQPGHRDSPDQLAGAAYSESEPGLGAQGDPDPDEAGYQQQYQGWAELRREERRYQ